VSSVNCGQWADQSTNPREQPPAECRKEGRDDVNLRDEAPDLATDEQLLAMYVAGDDAGFASLVERYSRELFPFLVRYVRDTALAEDVVQETFMQVYQSASSFDPGRRFRPWLFTIAVNKARDHLRSRTRKREVSLSSPSTNDDSDSLSFVDFLSDEDAAPSEPLESEEQREIVREVVAGMPDHLREILVLGYYHRFPYKEMAEVLSVPLGTVKSRLHAAVSHFARAYKQRAHSRATSTE